MFKRVTTVFVVASLAAVMVESASAQDVIVPVPAPVYYTPVAVPQVVVVQRPVVPVTYVTPAPVVVASPVVAAPVVAPGVVVRRNRNVVARVRATPSRTVVRERAYAPLWPFPVATNHVITRNTPRGVVVRQRGY